MIYKPNDLDPQTAQDVAHPPDLIQTKIYETKLNFGYFTRFKPPILIV